MGKIVELALANYRKIAVEVETLRKEKEIRDKEKEFVDKQKEFVDEQKEKLDKKLAETEAAEVEAAEALARSYRLELSSEGSYVEQSSSTSLNNDCNGCNEALSETSTPIRGSLPRRFFASPGSGSERQQPPSKNEDNESISEEYEEPNEPMSEQYEEPTSPTEVKPLQIHTHRVVKMDTSEGEGSSSTSVQYQSHEGDSETSSPSMHADGRSRKVKRKSSVISTHGENGENRWPSSSTSVQHQNLEEDPGTLSQSMPENGRSRPKRNRNPFGMSLRNRENQRPSSRVNKTNQASSSSRQTQRNKDKKTGEDPSPPQEPFEEDEFVWAKFTKNTKFVPGFFSRARDGKELVRSITQQGSLCTKFYSFSVCKRTISDKLMCPKYSKAVERYNKHYSERDL